MDMKVVLFFLISFFTAQTHAEEARFIDTNDGIIVDNNTGLMWTKDANLGAFGLAEMNQFVSEYRLSGYIDWRLPEKIEVEELINGLIESNSFDLISTPYGNCSYSPAHFALNDKYYQFSFCTKPHVRDAFSIPQKSALWLVRSGPSSEKRFTQEEVNEMIHDALQENDIDPIVLDTGNCTGLYTEEELELARSEMMEQCRNNPSSCDIAVSDANQAIGTVSSDLSLHLPKLHYQTLFGIQEIWANLEYLGKKEGQHLWSLQDFGTYEE